MEQIIDRRAFIWKSLLTATSGFLANPLLKAANALDYPGRWPEDFTLHKIANVLPVDQFITASEQLGNLKKKTYAGYTIARDRLVQRAELSIEKQYQGKYTVYNIAYWRNGTPAGATSSPDQILYKYSVNGQVYGTQNGFFAANRWTFRGDIYDLLEDRVIPLTEYVYSGTVKKKYIELYGADKPKRVQRPDFLPVHFKWLLSTMVKHLHTTGVQQPYRLAMIDEADIVHYPLITRPLKHINLVQDGNKLRFYAYLTLGPGMIPTVHWTNDDGDTVLFVTGLEGYFLTDVSQE
jgi:hypothetical protein